MVYIVHGDNPSLSRALIQNQQKKLETESKIEIDINDTSPEDFFEKTHSGDLFGKSPFVVLDVTKAGRTNVEKYIEVLKNVPKETVIIVYSEKSLSSTNAFIKRCKEMDAKVISNDVEKDSNIFKFIDALFYKNRQTAYKELRKLKTNQSSPFEIFPMILYGLRTIAGAKFNSPSFMKTGGFVKNKATTQAKGFSQDQIKKLFMIMYELDRGSKFGEVDPEMLVTLATESVLNS